MTSYHIHAANFDDDATKDALQTLAELYAPASAVKGVAKGKEVKRDRSVASVGDDDEDELDELTASTHIRECRGVELDTTSIEYVDLQRFNTDTFAKHSCDEASKIYCVQFTDQVMVFVLNTCLCSDWCWEVPRISGLHDGEPF